jgi:capsular polysaccharide transport system ATP-binding protein
MIEIKGLYKRYHHHLNHDWVLRDINLTIPTGVSVGLIGRNGAGKSTLLRLIAGMDTPERGSIDRQCRVSWPIGLSGGFQGSMTGRQNVKFVARVHGGRRDVTTIIERVQEFAELGDSFDMPINTYSSGMKARLNFGLSLAFDFDVYLSDEATSVGDRAFKAKASKAFKDKVGQASLIMVSHGEGILKELCQAGIYLKNGQATWYDDVKDAIAAYHEETGVANNAKKPAPKRPVSKPLNELTMAEAQKRLKVRKAAFNTAKAELEAARQQETDPDTLAEYQESFERARKRLQGVQRRVKTLQDEENASLQGDQ